MFVRHGETDGNRQRVYQVAEQPLNANGLAQARRAADALKSHPAKRIFASTMPRAWRTAEIIAAPHGLALIPSDHRARALVRQPRRLGHHHDRLGLRSAGRQTLVDFVERTRRGFTEALTHDERHARRRPRRQSQVLSNGLGLDLPQEMGANASPLLFERAGASWNVTPIGTINPLIGVAS